MTLLRTDERKKEREAERRQTLLAICRAAGTAAAPLHILPRERGRIKEGAARLSAFHRGSDGRAFARCARLQARLPGTRRERSILCARPNRGAETKRSYQRRYPPSPIPVQWQHPTGRS